MVPGSCREDWVGVEGEGERDEVGICDVRDSVHHKLELDVHSCGYLRR